MCTGVTLSDRGQARRQAHTQSKVIKHGQRAECLSMGKGHKRAHKARSASQMGKGEGVAMRPRETGTTNGGPHRASALSVHACASARQAHIVCPKKVRNAVGCQSEQMGASLHAKRRTWPVFSPRHTRMDVRAFPPAPK